MTRQQRQFPPAWSGAGHLLPFNDGKGGVPEVLEGAAGDGRSNFFPKYSPDGKWIVFCKADSYMLLQPDSDLYIIPAAGGVARRLRYNTARMNSWHSWSSNSKWLVFSSKVNTPYTQLFLTHIDENGNDSPPVLLERFTSPDRAANIPEFVKLPGDARQPRLVLLFERTLAAFVHDLDAFFTSGERKANQAQFVLKGRQFGGHQRSGPGEPFSVFEDQR